MKRRSVVSMLALLLAATAAVAQTVEVDRGIPPYTRGAMVSGNLSSVGSDTMNNLLTLWGEAFARLYPTVRIQVEGKGSSTAPPALIAGTAQLGPMSREMKAEELDAIEKKYGYRPIQIRAALDVLAVYVNKDNPIASLSLPEVDAIFSKTRKQGFPNDITTWGQLGLKGEWSGRPLSMFGRNAASGTYGYFKEHVLAKGDFKDTVKEQPGSASVVQGVTEDKFAIGYSGIGYRTSGVRALPLAAKLGGQPMEPSYENALSNKYPLARYLYIYVLRDPRRPMDPLVKEFLTLVLSREGQEVVVKDGFLPLPAAVAAEELAKLK
ncbi:MAG TPA: PstS family phosphate ABC transporter substrate-binding protein [Thermoanaerobaculaceae bacterium]|nr:PstS family phosphate ABC transporter substrate-binding protein [Thermoanaerobaculaceae bacterium]HRS14666.1 PstS family phosphate ABC transporter substrate-binding protein [Thermoanaerobaculaceae bacterium]